MPRRHTQSGSTPLWLLIWLVGMAAIAYWCVVQHLPAIQGQLQSNAQAAVTEVGAPDVNVNVEGRTAILTGAVTTTAQKDSLLGALSNASGIRHVDNQLNVVEVAIASNEENAAITETNNEASGQNGSENGSDEASESSGEAGENAQTSETQPNDDTDSSDTNATESDADQKAPANNADNDATSPTPSEDSTVTTESTSDTTTAGDDSDALNEQSTEQPGTEQLIDDVDAKARALIERAKNNQLRSNQPSDQAGNQPNNQPSDPASFKLRVADGTLTLTGNMSRQDNLTEFVRSAMSTFNASYVVNSIQVSDDVAPAPWLNSLTEFVGDMEPLNNAGIDLFESQISLSGVASSEQSHDAVINSALSKLSDLSLVERISIADANDSDNVNAEPTNATDTQAVTNTTTEQTATSTPNASASLRTEFNALASTTILFESGSDVLTTESLRTIESMAALFAEYPNTDIEIDGHTDSSGIASNNLNLSQQRANAVRDYLIKLGISANRLSAYGFGDGVPIADNSTSAGRKLNRRIEFNF